MTKFYILACDGGALKGVIPAEILATLEKHLPKNVGQYFDMFAGTSTGSIIATALASGMSAKDLITLYKRIGPIVFKKNKLSTLDVLQKLARIMRDSMYENSVLEKHFKQILKDLTFADLKPYLVVPYTNLATNAPAIFTNILGQSNNIKLRFSTMCSCAAPILFKPVDLEGELCCDGGLYANNPALIAVMRAHKDLGIAFSDMRVISMGCGHAKEIYESKPNQHWGLTGSWKGLKLVDSLFYVQHQSVNNMVADLIGPENLLELECPTSKVFPLDDPDAINEMLEEASNYYSFRHYDIMKFLGQEF